MHGNSDTNWKFACFVIENTDVQIEKNGVPSRMNFSMTVEDISDMRQNMSRFKNACEELSEHKMQAEYDFITIKKPLTTLSYDSDNGYHVAPANVKDLIRRIFR